jgi:hypothetical protein
MKTRPEKIPGFMLFCEPLIMRCPPKNPGPENSAKWTKARWIFFSFIAILYKEKEIFNYFSKNIALPEPLKTFFEQP